jgi:putative ABC transport system ATP-binding protein
MSLSGVKFTFRPVPAEQSTLIIRCSKKHKCRMKTKNSQKPANHTASNQPPGVQAHPLIRMCGVVKTYQTAAGAFHALKGIDLDVYPGEFVAIIGKSGAGKTTLVNMLTGVDHLSAGEVWVNNSSEENPTAVHNLKEDQLALWRGRNLGIIYQSFYLMPTLSLVDNVMLPLDLCGLFQRGKSKQRALDLLEQVGLAEHAYKLPSAISGGQQQRVAIARALVNDPAIIVADEPTGRLDSVTAATIFQIFLELNQAGKTLLMVTHDQNLSQQVTRSVLIQDGEIIHPSDSQNFEKIIENEPIGESG